MWLPVVGVIVMAILAVLGLATALSGFFLGMARGRRVGERAGLTGYSYSMGWAVGSFFVPLLNLYHPWVGLGRYAGRSSSRCKPGRAVKDGTDLAI